jgi:hypothetical protein
MIMTINGPEGVTKDENLQLELRRLLDLFKFIREEKRERPEGW